MKKQMYLLISLTSQLDILDQICGLRWIVQIMIINLFKMYPRILKNIIFLTLFQKYGLPDFTLPLHSEI